MEIEIKMYCDNKAAIAIANNLVQHDRTKHLKVDRHFIKQKLDEKTVIFFLSNPRINWQIYLLKQYQVKYFIALSTSWAYEISLHQLEEKC